MNFRYSYISILLLTTSLTSCNSGTDTPSNNSSKMIFFTYNNNQGYAGSFNGLDGANDTCQKIADNSSAQSNIPKNAKWKALLMTTGMKTTESAFALVPNTRYINESGEFIGTTNNNSIFPFPTNASLYASIPIESTTVRYRAWTGINIKQTVKGATWTPQVQNCNNWTNGTENSSGWFGISKEDASDIVADASIQQLDENLTYCNTNIYNNKGVSNIMGILCVQQ